METATFGAGCFWGVESFFREVPGVTDAACGYAGTFAVDGQPRNALTLALTTQFLAPAHAGQHLIATGRRTGCRGQDPTRCDISKPQLDRPSGS